MSSNSDHMQWLSRTYLFSALDEAQLRTVQAGMQEVRLDEGQILFEHNQPAEKFYLLIEGQVKLYRLAEDGDEKVIEIVRPGQTFAEAVMFMSGKVYPVNADALVKSTLLSFSSAVFKSMLHNSVDTCFRLMGAMSQRLHQRLNEIDSLTLHNATYRLVTYLLGELPEGVLTSTEIVLTTPKHIIASRLSIKPETFSRILTRLARDGLIVVRGNSIVLADIEQLRQLSEL